MLSPSSRTPHGNCSMAYKSMCSRMFSLVTFKATLVLRQPYRQDCWPRHSAALACGDPLAVLGNHNSVTMVEALETLDFEVLINRSI